MRLTAKKQNYLTDNKHESKTTSRTKRCVIKRKHKFEIYKTCLQASQLENKTNYLKERKLI